MENIYILNLSTAKFGIINVAPFAFAQSEVITDIGQLPIGRPAALYIVGHAVPNGLRDKNNEVVAEARVAEQLIARDSPTLVVFDVCFAEAFEDISGVKWPDSIGRIYSCMGHERTWHNGDLAPAGQSLFSFELNRAMGACIADNSFGGLESALRDAYCGLQQPVVKVSSGLKPKTFFLTDKPAN